MGFSYRKSFKAGPIRITASKSGISYSAGVKGARITQRADGRVQTTLSAPGTGLRYTTTAGKGKKPKAAAPIPLPPPQPRQAAAGLPGWGRPTTTQQRRFVGPPSPQQFLLPGATVVFLPDRIEIRRLWARQPGAQEVTVIPWAELVDVGFQMPSFRKSGYVQFMRTGRPFLNQVPEQLRAMTVRADPDSIEVSGAMSGTRKLKELAAAVFARVVLVG